MRRLTLTAGIAVTILLAALTFGDPASATDVDVDPVCAGVWVTAEHFGPNFANTADGYLDGVQVVDDTFGATYDGVIPVPSDGTTHTWRWIIATPSRVVLDESGTVGPCGQTTLPPTTLPDTTVPPTTSPDTTAPPTTSEVTTSTSSPPSTTPPTTGPSSTSPPETTAPASTTTTPDTTPPSSSSSVPSSTSTPPSGPPSTRVPCDENTNPPCTAPPTTDICTKDQPCTSLPSGPSDPSSPSSSTPGRTLPVTGNSVWPIVLIAALISLIGYGAVHATRRTPED